MLQKNLTTETIAEDYDRIYSSTGLRANSAYYRWLIRLLRPKPASRLLDVSCGEGIFLREFGKQLNSSGLFGLDISVKAVERACENCSASRIVVADGQRIPFKNEQFDYISCLGSLEHYLDPETGMRELLRVGKKDAKFCIVLPNSVSIDFLLHVMKTGDKPVDNFQVIERTATRKEWEEMLHKCGFEILKVYGSNLWPELFQEGTLKIKSITKYVRRKLIKIFCPVNLAREFVFICRKETKGKA